MLSEEEEKDYIDKISSGKLYLFDLPVSKQTEKICLASVMFAPLSLHSVKNQTEEICLVAIEREPIVLEDATQQTEKMCRLALTVKQPHCSLPRVFISVDINVYKYNHEDVLKVYNSYLKSDLSTHLIYPIHKVSVLKKISEILSKLSDEELIQAVDVDLKKIFRLNNTKICSELHDVKSKVKLLKSTRGRNTNVSNHNNKKPKFI